MKELIEAYLKDIGHHLSGCEIEYVCESSECNNVYEVHVRNDCLACGAETIHVRNSALLTFMWSKIK